MRTACSLRSFIPRTSSSSSTTNTIGSNCTNPQCLNKTQVRHATLIRRPKRPYTFTQLVTLSDGSSFTHRTTSPIPVYKSVKDTRNTQLWNPSSQKLLTAESDEAGKLRRFREKFGRGWDNKVPSAGKKTDGGNRKESEGEGGVGDPASGPAKRDGERQEEDNLMDLISGFGREAQMKVDLKNEGDSKDKGGNGKRAKS